MSSIQSFHGGAIEQQGPYRGRIAGATAIIRETTKFQAMHDASEWVLEIFSKQVVELVCPSTSFERYLPKTNDREPKNDVKSLTISLQA